MPWLGQSAPFIGLLPLADPRLNWDFSLGSEADADGGSANNLAEPRRGSRKVVKLFSEFQGVQFKGFRVSGFSVSGFRASKFQGFRV